MRFRLAGLISMTMSILFALATAVSFGSEDRACIPVGGLPCSGFANTAGCFNLIDPGGCLGNCSRGTGVIPGLTSMCMPLCGGMGCGSVDYGFPCGPMQITECVESGPRCVCPGPWIAVPGKTASIPVCIAE